MTELTIAERVANIRQSHTVRTYQYQTNDSQGRFKAGSWCAWIDDQTMANFISQPTENEAILKAFEIYTGAQS